MKNFTQIIGGTNYLSFREGPASKAKYYTFTKNRKLNFATVTSRTLTTASGTSTVETGLLITTDKTCTYSSAYITTDFTYVTCVIKGTTTTGTATITPPDETLSTVFLIDSNSSTNDTVYLVGIPLAAKTISDVPEGDYVFNYTDTLGLEQSAAMSATTIGGYRVYYVTNIDYDYSEQATITTAGTVTPTITNNILNTTAATYTGTNPFTVTVAANTGYKFTTAPTLTYTDESGTSQIVNMAISSDYKSATGTTGTISSTETEIVLTGSVEPETVEPTFVNNISNTTYNYIGSNHQYTVTITADTGYLFTEAPEGSYTGYSSGSSCSVTFALSTDKKSASAVIPDVDENTPITLTGTTTQEQAITVTNNVSDTTENHTYDGSEAVVIITGAATHKRFKNVTATYTNTSGESTTVNASYDYTGSSYTASMTCSDVPNNAVLTINGDFAYATYVAYDLTKCTSSSLDDFYFAGDTFIATLTAEDTTEFNTAPAFEYTDEAGEPVTIEFTVATDKLTATGEFTVPSYNLGSVTIAGVATPQTIIGENYGAINVYTVTLDNLETFSKVRFFKETDSEGGVTYLNLGDYVNRIKRIFATVEKGTTDTIKCGNYNTKISCYNPKNDFLNIDFGSVAIPAHNGNTTDFEGQTQLYLPFVGFADLASDLTGKTISLKLKIDVVTGLGMYYISTDGVVVQYIECSPSQDILYRTTPETTIGGESWLQQRLYDFEPYLYMKWYVATNTTGTNNTYKRDTISKFEGFCLFDDIQDLDSSNMTTYEYDSILSALKNGVVL